MRVSREQANNNIQIFRQFLHLLKSTVTLIKKIVAQAKVQLHQKNVWVAQKSAISTNKILKGESANAAKRTKCICTK